MEDVDGHDCKPDPLKGESRPRSFEELDDWAVKYWKWAGCLSTRKLADRSNGVFSHATIHRRLFKAHRERGLAGDSNTPTTQPFAANQFYLRAFIAACGGSSEDQRRWVTAWRRINETNVDR
ncbi:hypothetical protein [Actinomadura bangladeshensis]|uniref:Uncharacterized protein n=1 Tax=Actinomadura bangladeshensis TaxID=453573 RepID=A0A4R4P8L6_9ACTN|nr:hypothetical protein [Actinomadura bangladeshensis]TDC17260.1 hypothetical protein E1284_09930 [Actinomadura bangladeshensis]